MKFQTIQLGDLLHLIPLLCDPIGIHHNEELVYKGFVKDVPYEYVNFYVEKIMIIEERIDIYVSSCSYTST